MNIAGNESWFFNKWYEKPFSYWYFEPVSNFTPSIRNTRILREEQSLTMIKAAKCYLKNNKDLPYPVSSTNHIFVQNTKHLYEKIFMLVYSINPKQDYKVKNVDKDTGVVEVDWINMPNAAEVQQNLTINEIIQISGLKIARPDQKIYRDSLNIFSIIKALKSTYRYTVLPSDIEVERFVSDPDGELKFAAVDREVDLINLSADIFKKTKCKVNISISYDKERDTNVLILKRE